MKRNILEQIRRKLSIALPSDLLQLSKIFKAAGKDFYLVGGSVRDALMGEEPKDLDVTTNATPDEMEQILSAYPEYKVLELGKAFGIVKVISPEGNEYELATFRQDIGKGRRPDSVEFTTIDKDVLRRDLRMNALFYDIEKGEVVDYVGGIDDIENKKVRTVGRAAERFDEDRLRILRALRFAARFGTALDKDADEAILSDNNLEGVSGERIRDEFLKGIKSAQSPVEYYQLLDRYGLWKYIFPGLAIVNLRSNVKNIPIALSLLLKDNDPAYVAKKLNFVKYSSQEVNQIRFLLELLALESGNALKLKKIYKNTGLTDQQILLFADLAGIEQKKIESFLRYNPSVTASEFPELSGKELGQAINKKEAEIFANMLTESSLKELIDKIIDEQVIDGFGKKQYNWGLHPTLGPQFWNLYLKNIKDDRDLYFHPNPFTEEAIVDEGLNILDKGAWDFSRPSQKNLILELNPREKIITIFTSLQDPRVAYALSTSAKYIPELNEYNVRLYEYRASARSETGYVYKELGLLQNLLTQKKQITGSSPEFSHSQDDEEYKEFKYEVLRDVSDEIWYHATKLSNLDSILSSGLKTSKNFNQGTGWTELNFSLQNAVYLTSDPDYAEDIAETLAARFGAPAVVLKINGSALKDYTKIVVDEDSLRNEYDGGVTAGYLKQGMADYLTSVVDTIKSLGYKDTISPQFISIESVIVIEETEFNDVETFVYSWDEWKQSQEDKNIQQVDEMAIRQYKTIGNWDRRSSFKHDTDRKILTSPRGIEKIKRQWEKTPVDFDMYLINDPRVNKSDFREVGLVDMDFVRNKMKISAEEIPEPGQNTITVIYTSNNGAERYMSSGWILAHRLGHAIRLGRGNTAEKWLEFTNHLRNRVEEILKQVYGIDMQNGSYFNSGNREKYDKVLKYVAQQLGTMKSARDGNMRNWYEFAYELLAQYMLTGKIKLNPLPQSLITGIQGWGRKTKAFSKSEEARSDINEYELEEFALEIEGDLEMILRSAVGKVFVM